MGNRKIVTRNYFTPEGHFLQAVHVIPITMWRTISPWNSHGRFRDLLMGKSSRIS